MLASDNLPRNKILVVGRRGVGKLSLVQSILGSRFVPTTSVSKSRPSSPLILPACPVPTIEETIVDGHGALSQGISTFTPPNANNSNISNNNTGSASSSPTLQRHQQQMQQGHQHQEDSQTFTPGVSQSPSTQTRAKLDHSGVTIPWTIDTKYYSVQVDFWIDETDPQGRVELERMNEAGELDEMGAVIEAVVFCFSKNQPSTFHDIKPWLAFVERHEPSITLCIATGAPKTQSEDDMGQTQGHLDEEMVEDYDDWCLGNGFEFIDLEDQPSDMDQEEHVGLDRIMEALAAHMWDGLKRKSSKKRDQHDRSMMMSFREDDMDLTQDSSWRGNLSRRSLLGGLDTGDFSGLHLNEEEEEDDDSDDDDEDDDRVFSRALQELNLHNRSFSPTAPVHGLPLSQTMLSDSFSSNGARGSGGNDTLMSNSQGFDDDFDLDEQELQALESGHLEVWSSSQEGGATSSSAAPAETARPNGLDPMDRTLERQFRQFLGQPVDDAVTTSSENGGKESSLEMDSSLERDFSSFELNDDGEFEFGDFVVSEGPGGEELEDIDFKFGKFGVQGMSTPNQESIKSMHRALFSNIDEDEGMAQTIATIQGLREQGKNMSENERRELAARVALSFGMQMGE